MSNVKNVVVSNENGEVVEILDKVVVNFAKSEIKSGRKFYSVSLKMVSSKGYSITPSVNLTEEQVEYINYCKNNMLATMESNTSINLNGIVKFVSWTKEFDNSGVITTKTYYGSILKVKDISIFIPFKPLQKKILAETFVDGANDSFNIHVYLTKTELLKQQGLIADDNTGDIDF